MTDFISTNEQIAELLAAQTYAERMELARFLANAASDWTSDGHEADAEYFASLLESWEPEATDND